MSDSRPRQRTVLGVNPVPETDTHPDPAKVAALADLIPLDPGHRRRALLTLLRHLADAQEGRS